MRRFKGFLLPASVERREPFDMLNYRQIALKPTTPSLSLSRRGALISPSWFRRG
jgi:hypothetical protein